MERQKVYRSLEQIGGGSPEVGFAPARTNKPAQKPRQRRWTPKVKTGCITCRLSYSIRRVKCDEGRPACTKCISTGRQCDGFETAPEPPAPVLPSQHVLHALTPLYGQATAPERAMFDLFRTRTVTQVAGAFYQPFWHVDVLLAAQTQPALWHASLAMAAMYAWFETDDDDDDDMRAQTLRRDHYHFALRQYNAAIAHLVALAPRGQDAAAAEVLLMASVLFTGLSSLRGDPREAMLHASHGLRVARQWQFVEKMEAAQPTPSAALLPPKSLVGLVDGFEVQYMWTGARPPILRRGALPRAVPVAPFSSATEACFELQRLVGGLLTAVRSEKVRRTTTTAAAAAPVPDLRQPYRHALSAWKVKFAQLKWSQRLRQTDHDCALVLDIWLCGAEIAARIDLRRYELAWDAFAGRFRRIVRLARRLVADEALLRLEDRRPVYSFSPSVCEPLFMVASSCRDGALRREAMALLRQRPRREGIWDARLMAAIAEAKMRIEERGMAGEAGCGCIPGVYICNTHRVFFMDIEFLPERAATAVMKTLHDVAMGSEGQAVTITY
ncbi:C6 zinc finger domain [Cordyceps militaris]|uniref:C6 zinc finger domain n=1 Tax=Cordyceps militaris TaxID=73501 RepID=A0A2H4S7V2_CORMI|nr:C6 zinc finger domain [Cordyceps militaris]